MSEILMPSVTMDNGIMVLDTGDIDVLLAEHIEYVQAKRWEMYRKTGQRQRVLNLFGNLRSLNLSMTPELFSYMEECTIAIAWVQPPAFLERISAKYREVLENRFPVGVFENRDKAETWLKQCDGRQAGPQ